MRLRNKDRAPRSSGRRNNAVSLISEIKDTSIVSVRKKRGRRAPPSAQKLHDKRVDKVIESDSAVDSDNDDTDGQVGKGQHSAHIEEHVDGRTGDGLSEAGHSGNSSNGPSSASEEQDHSTNSKDKLQKASSQNKKKVFGSSTNSKQGASHLGEEGANEDGSHVQVTAVYKDIDKESSQKNRDDASDAQVDTTSSDDKSSEEVEDVKVCDICGDIGDEERLAVCSRCNDGAEHTYCMRVMMEEVPDGNSELKKPPLAKLPGNMMLSTERYSGGILGSGAHRKVIQNSDPSQRDTKIKDQTGFRQGAASSN